MWMSKVWFEMVFVRHDVDVKSGLKRCLFVMMWM